ncbi:MAG: ABC transporter substrate-binding protein [Treponema sp.]|nr:ABC transporter substrate-binding protein [Treponema sp.]
MKLQKQITKLLLLLSLIFSIFSCSSDDGSEPSAVTCQKFNLAVILPLSDGDIQKKRYERIADWYLSSLNYVMKSYDGYRFTFNLEWYDESTEDLAETGKKLAERDDILAIIGPMHSSNVDIVAEQCFKTKKTLLAPCLASEEVVHKYSTNVAVRTQKEPFLWALTETDATQVDAILSKLKANNYNTVSLISSADLYGKTFFDRVPFFAAELELTLKKNIRYISENTGAVYEAGTEPLELADAAKSVMESGSDYVICAMSSYKDAKAIIDARKAVGDFAPNLIFTDSSFSSEFLSYGEDVEGVEGIAPYASPASGFAIEYKARYDEEPVMGEAQLYDAFLMAGYAALYCFITNKSYSFTNKQINDALKATCSSESLSQPMWNITGMKAAFNIMKESGSSINIFGATGDIYFDEDVYTTPIASVYTNWLVLDGKFLKLDFTSTSGEEGHTGAHRAFWTWAATYDDSEVESSKSTSILYDELKSQWAVIIAGSKGWANYRHQADALYCYQLLKQNGWSDDNIILIIADDIANYKRNRSNMGKIFARLEGDGDNLYTDDVQIDYLIEELTVKDISNIMQGGVVNSEKRSELRTQHPKLVENPTVLNTDSQANILWFWSGHGANNGSSDDGFLVWNGIDDKENTHFTTSLMKTTLTSMQENQRYRKFLIITETCYSGSVLHVCKGLDGILAFTAANGSETSLADIYSVSIGVWLSNRFTHNFMDQISYYNGNKLVLKDLDSYEINDYCISEVYKYLVEHTIGSHVCIFNADHYGNLYVGKFDEFFIINNGTGS